jgi:hypothetical protein
MPELIFSLRRHSISRLERSSAKMPISSTATFHDPPDFRHRRCGVLAWQGHCCGVACFHSRSPRPLGHHDEARSLYQCGSGHDESLPARRGLCDRRRRGDRPRPGPLRALRPYPPDRQELDHHRQDLRIGDPQGTPRRLPGRHRAGDPAYHRRDQALHPRATRGFDVALVEIGGTVGDIESLPFLEAIRQLRIEHGPEKWCSCTSPWCRSSRPPARSRPSRPSTR